MVLRKRYWLYYALVFMSGARRQIFIVFAGFLMVEKFHYDVGAIALLFLLNAAINTWLAPKIGRTIAPVGARPGLIFEYLGLLRLFAASAFPDTAAVAAGLSVLAHRSLAPHSTLKTYCTQTYQHAPLPSTPGNTI